MWGQLNMMAIITSTIAAFALGALWYSSFVFGKVWMRAAGLQEKKDKNGHSALVFIFSFACALIAAFAFALFLGPNPPFNYSLASGLFVGICWVATSFGINYAFANRGVTLFLIDGGYHVAQFALYGIIMGLWHS